MVLLLINNPKKIRYLCFDHKERFKHINLFYDDLSFEFESFKPITKNFSIFFIEVHLSSLFNYVYDILL